MRSGQVRHQKEKTKMKAANREEFAASQQDFTNCQGKAMRKCLQIYANCCCCCRKKVLSLTLSGRRSSVHHLDLFMCQWRGSINAPQWWGAKFAFASIRKEKPCLSRGMRVSRKGSCHGPPLSPSTNYLMPNSLPLARQKSPKTVKILSKYLSHVNSFNLRWC